jgi:hypothetical protein
MITATLDAANEQSPVFRVPRTKTLLWNVDETSLADGEARLFVSRDGLGTFRTLASTVSDGEGRVYNDTSSDIYAFFVLVQTGAALSGSVVVSLEVESASLLVIRDPETGEPLLEFTDAHIKPLVPFDLSELPTYADNAAALAAGAAVGTAYVTASGVVTVVLEA